MLINDLYDLGYTQADVDKMRELEDEAAYMADDSDPNYEGDEE